MILTGGSKLNLTGLLRAVQGYQVGDGNDVGAPTANTAELPMPGVKSVGSLLSNIIGNLGSEPTGEQL